MATVDFLDKKQRNQNVIKILDSLKPGEHSFNTMILGFCDIMQSTFYNHERSLCRNQAEVDQLNKRIEAGINDVSKVLNTNALSNSEDMIILTTIMLDAINQATLRLKELGGQVDPTIGG